MSIYHQLPTSPASPDILNHDIEKTTSEELKSTNWPGPRLCFILCALCTLVNLVLSFIAQDASTQYNITTSISRKDIHLLRRPSQFIRFDEIERPSPPVPKQFNNYPILLAQIDSAYEDKVFPDDPRKYMSHVGTVSPEDRRVLVTETISTVVQFRAIDWGMEICELRLSLPPLASSSSGPSLERALLPSQSFPLSLYRLNATIPLDVTLLSQSTRPARIAKVGDVHFAPETGNTTLWHRKFACAEEEILTFELACAESTVAAGQGEACKIEWWQDKEHPDPAIFFVQYATK